jgi:hypothetical protein
LRLQQTRKCRSFGSAGCEPVVVAAVSGLNPEKTIGVPLSYAPIVLGKLFRQDPPACRPLVAQSAIDKHTYVTVSLEGNGYNYPLFHITFVWF